MMRFFQACCRSLRLGRIWAEVLAVKTRHFKAKTIEHYIMPDFHHVRHSEVGKVHMATNCQHTNRIWINDPRQKSK